MTNKDTVRRYLEGFNQLDHEKILSCLTEDVEWILPGMYHHRGKEAFDREIENDAFTGRPVITLSRLTEENDVVVAEGKVVATRVDGDKLDLAFCDIFEMRNNKIQKLVSYLMQVE